MASIEETTSLNVGLVRNCIAPVYADAPVEKKKRNQLNAPSPRKNKELTNTFKYYAKIDKSWNIVEWAIESENCLTLLL